MAINTDVDLKRLENQLYLLTPRLHKFSGNVKGRIRHKLYNQLQLSEPKVELEKYHVHKLLVNIEKNFQKCKDFGIIETGKEAGDEIVKHYQFRDVKEVNLSEQSDDDDITKPHERIGYSPVGGSDSNNLSQTIRAKSNESMHIRHPVDNDRFHKQSVFGRGRKRSCSIGSNETMGHVKIKKCDTDAQVTLTISLPSILKESVDNSLEISVDFGKMDVARKVLDQKISSISESEKNTDNSNSNCALAIQQTTKQSQIKNNEIEDNEVLSPCVISDALVEPNAADEETMCATAALVNINNNVCENYNSKMSLDRTKSSKKVKINVGTKSLCQDVIKKRKKHTKKEKKTTFLKGFPKNRRKSRPKNNKDDIATEKSDLAKYVELFSNNCEYPCTAASTSLSSSMSHVVSSTNENYGDDNRISNDNQTAQICYLINGEWTNGGICQLIPSSNAVNIGLDTGHIIQEDLSLNTPFEDFVNYIDSSNNDVENNEIARELEGNITHNTPSLTNRTSTLKNISIQNSRVSNLGRIPITVGINNLKKYKESCPPPAHKIEVEIIDLSLKSGLFNSTIIEDDESSQSDSYDPIDLSIKSSKDKNQLEKREKLISQREDESDEVFIRCLIDNSDSDCKDNSCNQTCGSTADNDLIFEPVLEENESYKVALDMPLLDNDMSYSTVKQNVASQECDKNLNDHASLSLGELVQSNLSHDITTLPHLTYIHKQNDSTKKLSTQIGLEKLKNMAFANESVEKGCNTGKKIKNNRGKPPLMSLISKSESFSTNIEVIKNVKVSEERTNSTKTTAIEDYKESVQMLTNQSHQQSADYNGDDDLNDKSYAFNKKEDDDAGHLSEHEIVEVINYNDSQINKIINDRNDLIENVSAELRSKVVEKETIDNKTSEHNNVEKHESYSVDDQLETENIVKKNIQSTVDLELNDNGNCINVVKFSSKTVDIHLESKTGRESYHCVDADFDIRDTSVANDANESIYSACLENINGMIQNTIEYENKYKEDLCKNNFIRESSKRTNLEHDGIHSSNEASKIFISKDESSFDNNCSSTEADQNGNVNINNIESYELEIEESSRDSVSVKEIENTQDCLLLPPTEKNFTTTKMQKRVDKESVNLAIENADNMLISSCNFNQSDNVVTYIEGVGELGLENKSNNTPTSDKNAEIECKKVKPACKLQIISIVAIDSFKSLNEDDNEFIRRTLKSSENNEIIKEFTNSNLQLAETLDDIATNEVILKKSKDCLKVDKDYKEENVDIEKEALTKTADDSKKITEEYKIKIRGEHDVALISEIMHENNTNETSTQSELKEFRTNEFVLEQTKFKDENIQQSYNTLDESKNEKIIISSEQPNMYIKSIDVRNDIKTVDTVDVILDFTRERMDLDDKGFWERTTESIFSSELDQENNSNCLVMKKNKSSLNAESDDYSRLTFNEILRENDGRINTQNDTEKKRDMTVESHNDSAWKNTIETFDSRGQTKEAIITAELQEVIPPCNQKSYIFSTNLSLLDMEKQFDDSLDFDNNIEDDVLSLATSCFNSPDDDRLVNSKILEESDDADKKQNLLKFTKDDNLEADFVEICVRQESTVEIKKELDNKEPLIDPISVSSKFIIPKLNSAKMTEFVQETNECQPTKKIEHDKITRTVPNVCAVPPFPLLPTASSFVPNSNSLIERKHAIFSSSTGNEISGIIPLEQKLDCVSFVKDVLTLDDKNNISMSRGHFAGRGGEAMNRGAAIVDIARIFGVTCFPFLVDKCPVLGNSQHNHQLRNAGFVQVALEGLPNAELNCTYKFMMNHSKLFRHYFFVFCSVYAKQNNRNKLLSMVNDCEKHIGCVLLLRNIFYSLIECGLSKINACRQILSRSRDKSSGTIDVLVGIIFETDWSMFSDYLEQLSQIPHYSFRINFLSEMAGRVLETKDTRLCSVVCKCLFTLNRDDYKLVSRTPNLIALLELMKDGKVC